MTTGVLGGVAAMPGFLLNRIGWLLLGTGALDCRSGRWRLSEPSCHVTASSSVRVVKLSLRLRPGDPEVGA